MKIAIIGTGRVGSSIAYALVLKQSCGHLIIAGRSLEKARGDALDLQHTMSFCSRPMRIEACANQQVSDADIIVITASVATEGQIFTSRLQLGDKNIAMFRELIPMLAASNPNAILVIVTNPVDVMTYAAAKLSGFLPSRVMGVGTLVDSARFRALLSHEEHIHPDDLRTYILGEHGPNQLPILSSAEAGGELIRDTPRHRELFTQVIEAGFEVYRLKGYTNHAIATAASMVIEAVIFDEYRTMPLATRFDDWMGIRDNCFSIPVVVGRSGIIRHLHPEMNADELQSLQTAAAAVKRGIVSLIPDLVG
ncbi:Malate dehydrogenase (NAD) [Candidatus Methylobacter favarea]|uniref:Malate dehydrogenase (NAD) n=1 Tax=Candidatus Methylobacter favarea TaxID=2707345 RepID=A0A8S0XIY2_9GAMM|nr:lactate/malate dehydrogenase family protein [Candidatus Methylobacter favarea]CAA9892783.1 Malate dehydrogenase (NAD) [Candidatus Methylobacter favarea]